MSIMLLGTIWVVGFLALFVTQERQVNLRFQQTLSRLYSWTPAVLGIPTALSVGDTVVLPTDNNRVDIVAMVANPNAGWGATDVILSCTVGAETISVPATFINPSETRPVVLTSQVASGTTASCSTISQTWHRAVAALIVEPKFSVIKKDVVSTTAIINGKSVPVVRVEATVQNDSGNNFQEVDVALLVKAGEEIVAADILPLNRWATRSAKVMTNTWTLDRAGITSVEIIPLVSRFDPEVIY